MRKNTRQVVITGIGMVSPLGLDVKSTWTEILRGTSAAAPIRQFDASSWPTQFACEVPDFELNSECHLPQHLDLINRPTSFGLEAAYQAMKEAAVIDGLLARDRFGVAVGAGLGAISPHDLAQLLSCLDKKDVIDALAALMQKQRHSHFLIRNHPGILATLLAERWDARGPVTTTHTACASSAQAIGQALHFIQRGTVDMMLVGGADSLAGELLLAGFSLLGAISRRNDDPKGASRPFDRQRDGFVAGEGAAFLVLEEETHARERGVAIQGKLAGYGETMSAYRITDLPPDGRGIIEAMCSAIEMAGLQAKDIGYINAHGTATTQNDAGEAEAIRRVYATESNRPYVGSTKSLIGHLISAAGAIETLFAVLALRDQKIPPNRNLTESDCGPLNFAPAHALAHQFKGALSNSIGFGGSNASIVVTREN